MTPVILTAVRTERTTFATGGASTTETIRWELAGTFGPADPVVENHLLVRWEAGLWPRTLGNGHPWHAAIAIRGRLIRKDGTPGVNVRHLRTGHHIPEVVADEVRQTAMAYVNGCTP